VSNELAGPIVSFLITGVVERGDQRGRTLGMPTANVAVARHAAFPDEGVYAGVVTLADRSRHCAAVSIGRRPTFYAEGFELCEAHLLDFEGDLYGQQIEVLLTHHIRGQIRFDGVDALIQQMRDDCDLARRSVNIDFDADIE
jgi:riboflavin kinase/FMN adenylyltransferase